MRLPSPHKLLVASAGNVSIPAHPSQAMIAKT